MGIGSCDVGDFDLNVREKEGGSRWCFVRDVKRR